MTTLDIVAPACNLDVEAAALGAAIQDPEAAAALLATLEPGHFYSRKHQELCAAIAAATAAGHTVDAVTVRHALAATGATEATVVDVADCIAAAPSGAQIAYHCTIILEMAERRNAHATAAGLLRAVEQNRPLEEIRLLRQACAVEPLTPGRTTLRRADEIECHPPHWLVTGLLERECLAVIFGPPGAGKSFVCMDWAFRIATGTAWMHHRVKPAPVVYYLGEGAAAFGRRRKAWELHNDRTLQGAPLYIGAMPLLTDSKEAARATAEMDALDNPPALIVIDTLSRTLGGADENNASDVMAVVSACDAWRHKYSASVLLVHHVGHAAPDRARGSSALRAAADVEYKISTTSERTMTLAQTKAKDALPMEALSLELETVRLNAIDENGEMISSAAVTVAGIALPPTGGRGGPGNGKWMQIGLEVCRELADEDGRVHTDAWCAEVARRGMPKRRAYKVTNWLLANHCQMDSDGYFVIAPNENDS